MNLRFKKTERGFELITFEDEYSHQCSIQESSLATQSTIWFGIDDTPKNTTKRMLLSREQVAELIPILQHFVYTGDLPEKQ